MIKNKKLIENLYLKIVMLDQFLKISTIYPRVVYRSVFMKEPLLRQRFIPFFFDKQPRKSKEKASVHPPQVKYKSRVTDFTFEFHLS